MARTKLKSIRICYRLSLCAAFIFLLWWPVSNKFGLGYDHAFRERDWLGRRTGSCFRAVISRGAIYLGTTGVGYKSGFYCNWLGAPSTSRVWLKHTYRKWGNTWDLTIPLWYFVVAWGCIALTLRFLSRRIVPDGHCQSCSYSLVGNTSGVCPECGTVITSKQRDPSQDMD